MILFAGVFTSVLFGGPPSPQGSSSNATAAGSGWGASTYESAKQSSDESGEGDDPDDGSISIERSGDGHFYADVQINGASVRALIDTGASGIALSRDDARSAGLATSIAMPNVVGRGADGDVHGEYVTINRIRFGHKSAEEMRAVVLNAGEQSLLGQEFLSKFDSVEIRGDKMVLR